MHNNYYLTKKVVTNDKQLVQKSKSVKYFYTKETLVHKICFRILILKMLNESNTNVII